MPLSWYKVELITPHVAMERTEEITFLLTFFSLFPSFFFFFLGENRKDPLLHSYSSTSLGFPCRNQVISSGTIISLFHHLFDSSAQAVNKVL